MTQMKNDYRQKHSMQERTKNTFQKNIWATPNEFWLYETII